MRGLLSAGSGRACFLSFARSAKSANVMSHDIRREYVQMSESVVPSEQTLSQGANHSTFFDYRSLAAFRILLGIALLWNLYMRASHGRIDALYAESGVLPVSLLASMDRWSLLDAFSTHLSVRVAFCFMALVYLAYTFGFLTRFVKWAVVVCLLCLYHRNPLVDDGSDWTMRLFALWTAFLPLGRVWSVDSVFFNERRWAREADSRLATIGICCNLGLSYLFNVIQKTGDAWRTGDALHRVLWDTWVVTPVSVAVRDSSLCGALGMMGYSALALETVLAISAVLSLRSLWARRIVCVGIIVLHGTFGLMLYLGTFVPLYIAIAFLFVPSQDWRRICLSQGRALSSGGRSWLIEIGAAVMLIWCVHQNLLNNPAVPGGIRHFIRSNTPGSVDRVSRFLMIPQEWYMFLDPSPVVSTVLVSARSPDGMHVDPIRHTPFDPRAVFLGSSYAGKYWISYLIRLLREGNHRYRARFADYFFEQGFDEVEVMLGTMPVPRACGEKPGEISLRTVFRANAPRTLDITTSNIAVGATRIRRAVNQAMSRFGPHWSQGSQLFAEFTRESPTLTIEFDSARECVGTVSLLVTHAPDYGVFDMNINDGPPVLVDLYSPFGVERHAHTIGRTKLRKGTNSLKVTFRDDAETQRTKFGLDGVQFVCNR